MHYKRLVFLSVFLHFCKFLLWPCIILITVINKHSLCVCAQLFSSFLKLLWNYLMHEEPEYLRHKGRKWLQILIMSFRFWPGKASDLFFFLKNIHCHLIVFPNEPYSHCQIFISSPCLTSPTLKFHWDFDLIQYLVPRLLCYYFWSREHPTA